VGAKVATSTHSPPVRRRGAAKTAGAQSEDVPLFTRRRTGGEWVEVATQPHHQQAMPRNRAKRGAKTAGAQSEDVPLFTRRPRLRGIAAQAKK